MLSFVSCVSMFPSSCVLVLLLLLKGTSEPSLVFPALPSLVVPSPVVLALCFWFFPCCQRVHAWSIVPKVPYAVSSSWLLGPSLSSLSCLFHQLQRVCCSAVVVSISTSIHWWFPVFPALPWFPCLPVPLWSPALPKVLVLVLVHLTFPW